MAAAPAGQGRGAAARGRAGVRERGRCSQGGGGARRAASGRGERRRRPNGVEGGGEGKVEQPDGVGGGDDGEVDQPDGIGGGDDEVEQPDGSAATATRQIEQRHRAEKKGMDFLETAKC